MSFSRPANWWGKTILGSLRTYATKSHPKELVIGGKSYQTDEHTNVTPLIMKLASRRLHLEESHPIGILRDLIENRFSSLGYTFYNDFTPVVSVFENFDALGFPQDHPSRAKSDTYYINKDHLLRTHTSAHEHECFSTCKTDGYFISADVYRRDEIDRTHYPAFHQLEGARTWKRDELLAKIEHDIELIPKNDIIVEDCGFNPETNPKQDYMTNQEADLISQHLKRTIELLVNEVFNEAKIAAKRAGSTEDYLNEPLKVRWVEAYFPWTAPSYEIEVWWKGEWLECCGCGIVREQVLTNSGNEDRIGWAFGIGLDRIAMLLFGIPDIRLLWTFDDRFKSQFKQGKISTFKPYSRYPGISRDIAFWLPEAQQDPLHENDLMEIVRNTAGDLVESVKMVDEFVHPKSGRKSQCYRINYQSMDRSLTHDEINEYQSEVQGVLSDEFGVVLR